MLRFDFYAQIFSFNTRHFVRFYLLGVTSRKNVRVTKKNNFGSRTVEIAGIACRIIAASLAVYKTRTRTTTRPYAASVARENKYPRRGQWALSPGWSDKYIAD